MQIVFENDHLLVADKPPLVLTTPARDPRDARPCLGRQLQGLLNKRIYPVHRLDFEVSGLVLFALTPEAHRVSQGWFERAEVVKTYEAQSELCPPSPPLDWVEWRCRLVRGKRRAFEAAHGSLAITRARMTDQAACRWELQPVTGRPHQLRFEMARHGHPIVGDTLYGARPLPGPGIALRAVRLDFSAIAQRLGLPALVSAVASPDNQS